jgi:hypothetical protein
VADCPTGWWVIEIATGFLDGGVSRLRKRSKEETATIQRIAGVWILTFSTLAIAGHVVLMKVLRLHDDLFIYRISALLFFTVPVSLWLARRIFVLWWPQLSEAADRKAAERIAAEETRRKAEEADRLDWPSN